MTEEFSQRRLVGAPFRLVDLSDASFEQVTFKGARFRSVDLSDATFEHATFQNARFRDVDLRGLRIRGAFLVDVELSGEVTGLRVNGVDVGPLVEAELDRRYPERVKLRATDAAGLREAWAVIEDLWAGTIARARRLEPALLHEHVDDEWSFIETLRHLLFATDAWIGRVMLGNPSPWDPLDLPWDQMPDTEGIPRDRSARPALDVVLALRADRMATVRQVFAELTDEQLAESTEPVLEPGWPESRPFPVREVLDVVLNEEWWHRQFAERDLDALADRRG